MKKRLLFFALLIFASACTKELDDKIVDNNVNPAIADIPVIELISVSSTSVQAYQDSITFKIEYLDGNGDLGTDDPDATSVELIDNRDPDLFVFEFHLSPRSPIGTELTLQGELDIVLDNTILLDSNNSTESTTFSIRIKDRAGNWSNTVETETIEITQ